ncbi:MAG: DNA polymerase I, partial [Oscillospiraceae bacterium]|nr:DNA polymerase I [Oscillospiraceae bacterium]
MKFLAIDGNSILNRAFYGIKLLTTKDGQYTNGIYGFLNILIKLEQEIKPDCVAVAFDLKAKTFRHKMFDGYKAGRKGMPDELAQQMPVLRELLADLGYTIVTKEGFEADDILGTIAKSCSARGDECYIATGDRDSLQLIDDNVHVALATTQMGKGSTQIMDREAVFEKYGLYPEKLIDLKALMGDTSDNIPGVKGVGEKTAVTLLQNFGSLDGVYENIDDAKIKKGVREKLVNDKDMAYLSKILGTIRCDVDMDTSPESYVKKAVNNEKVSRTLKHLEMFSLADKLVPQQSVENLNLFDVVESALDTVEIKEFDNSLSKAIIYQNNGRFIIMWNKNIYSAAAESELLKAFLADESKEKIAYDSKALYTFCLEKGIDIKNVSFCMKLAAYLANPLAPSYDFERITASADAVAEFDCEDSFA